MNTSKNNAQNASETKNYKVYIHINKINSKKYIGITKQSVKRRWQSGYGYYNQNKTNYFWNAIHKYGWNNFDHIILEENLTHKETNEKERYYIAFYKSNNPNYGYNLTLGGDGFLGQKRSEETKKKISKTVSEYFLTHEGYWKGKKIPAEAVAKQKMTKKSNPYHHTEEWKKNHSNQLKGANNSNAIKVQCITTGMIFNCIKDAAHYYNIDNSRIGKCCKGVCISAGKHPETGEKLLWKYAI